MPTITAVLADITEQDVDVIVNPANPAMRGGGGVDGAIHSAGGPQILHDCIERFPHGLAIGDAGWTTGGDLPARWVVHTVGPDYGAGQRDRALLESCYRRSLQVADELGARSIAFPLISAGVYAWPLADAITIAVETTDAVGTSVGEIRLVAFDQAIFAQLRSALLLRRPPTLVSGMIGALFARTPTQFGLRGDAYLWRELQSRFAGTPLPDHWSALRILIEDAIEEVVGQRVQAPKTHAADEDLRSAIYVPAFDPGHGMSAGMVDIQWWSRTGVPILLDRYAARHGA